jgi:hypothetical protein
LPVTLQPQYLAPGSEHRTLFHDFPERSLYPRASVGRLLSGIAQAVAAAGNPAAHSEVDPRMDDTRAALSGWREHRPSLRTEDEATDVDELQRGAEVPTA